MAPQHSQGLTEPQTQITELFAAAFSEPIPASKMIGFRFIVGGGKKEPEAEEHGGGMTCGSAGAAEVRRRHAKVLPRRVERDRVRGGSRCECGEKGRGRSRSGEDRRGGGEVQRQIMECAGTFKYQHDTDKDLKFIHVFPKIDLSAAAAPSEEEEESDIKIGGMKVPPPIRLPYMTQLGQLEELPPEHLCSIVSMETFVKLVAKQCPSFSQRRALLKALKDMAAKIAGGVLLGLS
eukprot:327090-Hanusia_phi.AAC.4